MSAATWLAFALASAAGALVRWAATAAVDHGRPAGRGTATVNAVGSAILGVLAGAALRRGVDPSVVTVVGLGFCGSMTTFSTFAVESLDAIDRAGPLPGAANVVLSVLAPLAAAGIGLLVAAALWS